MARNSVAGYSGDSQQEFYRSLLVQNEHEIEKSWQRCAAAGMEPGDRPERPHVTDEQLRASYFKQGPHLCGLARAEMRTLYKYLGNRGFTLTLANPDSVIVDRIPGKDIFAGYHDADDLAPGSCWYETARGTNAVGTAANSKQTTVVITGDHFLREYHDLICIAQPVYAPDDEVIAIFDATIHCRRGRLDLSELTYVLGLMHMSADHIETELFKARHRNLLVIQVNAIASTVASTNAALAFDASGQLVSANRAAFCIFEAQGLQPGVHFEHIFRHDFSRLYGHIERSVDFQRVEDHQGCHYHATLYAPDGHDRRWDRARSSGPSVSDKSANRAHGQDNEGAGFMGRDPMVLKALATVERATAFGAPVLIRGETGTGKELLARHIHRVSDRIGEFVGVNCAAVPESLIEAELFGYESGAFTGASKKGALGRVREADGGTLFLDEIGDMSYDLQARLLRLLDSWRVRPVGSDREYEVDVQLVTATNRDLEKAVEQRQFRPDLLHRIKVVEACLPALRERTDFDAIARFVLAEIEPAARLDEDALDELRGLRWEGNMRELHNILLRLVIAADGAAITKAIVGQEPGLGGFDSVRREFGPVDDDELNAVFRRCRGNIAATARELHISRTTVYKHLRRLGTVASVEAKKD